MRVGCGEGSFLACVRLITAGLYGQGCELASIFKCLLILAFDSNCRKCVHRAIVAY